MFCSFSGTADSSRTERFSGTRGLGRGAAPARALQLPCLALVLLTALWLAVPAQASGPATMKSFTEFAAELPAGWTGEERTGFSTNNPNEYMLVLGRQDHEQNRFLAQISIYLLPNTPGKTAEDFARGMAERQGEASTPRHDGLFWAFTGIPRIQTLKGQALTRVNADKDWILIIIAQDPDNIGAEPIVASLKGLTPRARLLLGR